MDTQTEKAMIIFTPSEVVEIIKRKLQECELSSTTPYFVRVKGLLGTIPPSKYNAYYGVPLKDASGGSILLDIPKEIIKESDLKAYQGKEIIVTGFIKSKIFNNQLTFSISASRIEPVQELSAEAKELEINLFELLQTHHKGIKHFPELEIYNIQVIHGASSEVKDDFERQLMSGESYDNLKITYSSINITSKEAMKEAILSSLTDILVIIRGGGDNSQFEVFNDFELLEVWNNHPAFKISALGHTKHRTLFDTFASVSCDTPTEAGAYIRRNIDALKTSQRITCISEEHKKEMESIRKEFTTKLEEILRAKDEVIKRKDEAINEAIKSKDDVIKGKDTNIKELNEKIETQSKEVLEAQKQLTEAAANLEKTKAEIAKEAVKKEAELTALIQTLTKDLQTAKMRFAVATVCAAVVLVILLILLIKA